MITAKENIAEAILAQIQKQNWVMEPKALNALLTQLAVIEVTEEQIEAQISPAAPKLNISGSTAVISIHGVLLKKVPWLFRYLDIETTQYSDIQNQIAEALGNPVVKSIRLDVDSPGGEVPGVLETAQAIAQANKVKKVTAQVDDLAASGAYWLASQASKITAKPNDKIGSIGVYTVYVDSSEFAKNAGFKVHIIRSGEHKGMGILGAEITENQIAAVQEVIDGIADNFVKAVSSGRGKSVDEIRQFATGRAWLANEAKKLGLIDNVIKTANSNKVKEKNNMENNADTIQKLELTAETFASEYPELHKEITEAAKAEGKAEGAKETKELFAKFTEKFGDDPALCIEQFGKGATIEQAVEAQNVKLKEAAKNQDNRQTLDPAAGEFSDQQQPEKTKVSTGQKTDEQLKEEFEQSDELKAEFGEAKFYIAYVRAEENGQVSIGKKE